MRRFASVFASSRRSDKSDAPSTTSSAEDSTQPRDVQKKRSRMFNSLSRKHPPSTHPPSLPPLIASDLTNSSSSSSSGSTTLRTPDDDGLLRTPSKKGNWKSWLGGKNSAASDHLEEQRSPSWQSSPNLHCPPKPVPEDASSQSEDEYGQPDEARPLTYSPQQMATARANARTLILNSLVQQHTSPPLLPLTDAVSFPRSCHNSRRLPRRETLESELHKKSLLARLDRLSPSAERSIAPLASKVITLKSQSHRNFQEDFYPPADSVSAHSIGLATWVARPYFEERLQLWSRQESGEVICTQIPGSKLGVPALEFSETLELLAGTLLESEDDVEQDLQFDPGLEFTLPAIAFDLDAPAPQMKEVELQPPSQILELSPSDPPTKPSPPSESPRSSLRQSLPKASSPSRQANESSSSESAPAHESVPKRGVRFADDDGKDDQIPLGYVLRIRKNKEQKARFLREERERRARAAQATPENRRLTVPPHGDRVSRVLAPRQVPSRPLVSLIEAPRPQKTVSRVVQEEERLRREAERIEMEKLRRSRELARKQAEERERAYAEELQATRLRREAARAGRPLESASIHSRTPDRDRSGSRDSRHASLRRSSMSHKYTPELVLSPTSPLDGSPSSSLPPTPGSQYSLSRPPSLYSAHTASSEDIRARDGKRVSRRMSMASEPAKQMMLQPPFNPRASFNPYAWANGTLVPAIPPVPPLPTVPMVNGMPFYGMDMPLLPPSPPFMMNQYGSRPRSYTGSQGQPSPLQSSTSLPRNHSSEGVNNSSSRNSSSQSIGTHQRRSSDDSRISRTFGDSRPGSYSDLRVGRGPTSARPPPAPSTPHRSSWLPSEQSPGSAAKKSSSLRPVSVAYPAGSTSNSMRRRTAAS